MNDLFVNGLFVKELSSRYVCFCFGLRINYRFSVLLLLHFNLGGIFAIKLSRIYYVFITCNDILAETRMWQIHILYLVVTSLGRT